MDRTNPPEQVPMPALDTIIDTLTVYEMPSGRDTSIVITDENKKYLNYPGWKEAKRLCSLGLFHKANEVVNNIRREYGLKYK